MTVREIERLYGYGCWANRHLLSVVSQLTTEQFTRNVAGSYGSVRNTLVHTLSTEWGWLERCGGHPRGPALKAADFPSSDDLRQAWERLEEWERAFLEHLADEDLDRVVEYRNGRGEPRAMVLGELMQHAVIHGVHHRGQVALLLRELGLVPGNFDMLFYDAERRQVLAW